MGDGGQYQNVLAGTYRRECKKWILSKLLYNYPVGGKGAALPFDPGTIERIDLCNRNAPRLRFASSFQRFVGPEELRRLGYPAASRPHAGKYALFSLKPLDGGDGGPEREKAGAEEKAGEGAAPGVRPPIARLGDFAETGEEKAFLSHWMHNRGGAAGRPYEKRARALLPGDAFGLPGGGEGGGGDGFRVCEQAGQLFFPEIFDVPFPPPERPRFTFIDLFAGIGGFRIALQNCGGKCVFSSEWDEAAQKTYLLNYGESPFGDITKPAIKAAIPGGMDIVCAGFPCQAFSMAGKKMGFKDNYKGMSRGTLFRDVVEICEKHRPKVIFCENVKGLTIHDKGKTFTVIKGAFAELGYRVHSKILNSKDFGVPQNRERIYIVAFRGDIDSGAFSFPGPTDGAKRIRDILQPAPIPSKYYLSETYLQTLIRHKARHEAKGNGFGYEVRPTDGIAGAIVCGGMGRERNLIVDEREHDLTPTTRIRGGINARAIRKMTPREWARLQGYPEKFVLGVADVHLYKQFGNSVSVPVIQAVAGQIMKILFP